MVKAVEVIWSGSNSFALRKAARFCPPLRTSMRRPMTSMESE